MASWWAFENSNAGNGFEGGYKEWLKAADATSHLFFAYLRSLSPQKGLSSFAMLPMSLQKLLQETEYPPQRPSLLQSSTNKVVMIVDAVSPTPFALLRRGSHFQYRDEDRALREFSDYEDPVQALTDECRRVLKAVSAANQTQAVSSSKHSTGLRDASWSRFEDIGFGSLLEEEDDEEEANLASRRNRGLRTTPASGSVGLARPTTPSWADFLSSGFVDDGLNSPTNMLLPPDKVLPPIDTNIRQRSSQSHRPRLESERTLEPGELASISRFDLDDSFWWVWMLSIAPEETPERKSVFGRCAVVETRIRTGRWLVMEEIVKGAAAEPDPGAYIAEKKGFFSWTRRNKGVSRSKSTGKQALDRNHYGHGLIAPGNSMGVSKTSIAPAQEAKIHAAAQKLQEKQRLEASTQASSSAAKRGRMESGSVEKTTSVFTIQPVIASEASPALKWASRYDKEATREAYLSNSNAGRGNAAAMSTPAVHLNGMQSKSNGIEKPLPAETTRKPVPMLPSASQPSLSQPSSSKPPAPVAAAPPSPLIAPIPRRNNDSSLYLSEKAVEAELPAGLHPAERSKDTGLPSPLVPPKDIEVPPESAREAAMSPVPAFVAQADTRKTVKKLHKEIKEEKAAPPPAPAGGLRKLFGRKNRQSKLPDNAAMSVNAMLAADAERAPARIPPAPAPAPVEKSAVVEAPEEVVAAPAPRALPESAPTPTPVAVPTPEPAPVHDEQPVEPPRTPTVPEPIYEASNDSLSRVGTAEAQDADREFSRFDQGPLVEQPAFVPGDSDNESDEAVPPPIARQRSPVTPTPADNVPATEAKPVAPVLDRWAQLKKNAAERAAQRQATEPRRDYSKPADGDDDTSGEESKSDPE